MVMHSVHAQVIACATSDSSIVTHSRPKKYGAFSFTHFLSNVSVELNGKQYKAYPGDCLIHASNHPQVFHGEDSAWDSDWCVFDGSGIHFFIKELGLPINQLFRPASTHFVPPLLERITLEHERKANRWNLVVSLGLQELLIKLSRHWVNGRAKGNGHGTIDPLEKLQEVRTIVHDQLEIQWSVADMAKLCNLSTSRFAFLYKKCFEVSPMEDLIRKRIRQATILLSDTSKNISVIAEESGFEDLQYFYRAFRKRIGTTPRSLRKRNSSSSPWRSYEEERGKLESIWASSDFHGMIGMNDEKVPFIQAISGNWSKLGWGRKELTSIPFFDFFHDSEKHLLEKAYQTISTGGIVRDLQLVTLCNSGLHRMVAWTGAETGGCFYFSANIGKQV
ncbi:MAG: hypothetical protein CMI30_09170 [Opitutae bacterium]|nr:hypothetical protein [Opitutae bacterium]